MRAAILTACIALTLPGTMPSRADDLYDLHQRVDDLEMRLDDLEASRAAPLPRLDMTIPYPKFPTDRAPTRVDEATRWLRETPPEWRGVPPAPKPLPEPTWYGNWVPRR